MTYKAGDSVEYEPINPRVEPMPGIIKSIESYGFMIVEWGLDVGKWTHRERIDNPRIKKVERRTK